LLQPDKPAKVDLGGLMENFCDEPKESVMPGYYNLAKKFILEEEKSIREIMAKYETTVETVPQEISVLDRLSLLSYVWHQMCNAAFYGQTIDDGLVPLANEVVSFLAITDDDVWQEIEKAKRELPDSAW
jgi:hypothetical protein